MTVRLPILSLTAFGKPVWSLRGVTTCPFGLTLWKVDKSFLSSALLVLRHFARDDAGLALARPASDNAGCFPTLRILRASPCRHGLFAADSPSL